MQSGNADHKNSKEPVAGFLRPGLRNRLAGSIAVVFGILILAILIIENRWDNHDTVKPIKALLGSIFFIAGGLWYIWKGARAEPWKEAKNHSGDISPAKLQTSADRIRSNLHALAEEEYRKNVAFRNECQRVETEMRDLAKKMEAKDLADEQGSNTTVDADARKNSARGSP